MKKRILFIYDSMMIGGTTTALLSLINAIDKKKYDISLLLYNNIGAYFREIPEFVHVLDEAYIGKSRLSNSKRKIIRTFFNGNLFRAFKTYFKYKDTAKGNIRTILMHYGMKAQVSLSRNIDKHYDVAIGFMEGWANEYVSSDKISATKKIIWIHPQYESCYLIPEIDKKIFANIDNIVLISEKCIQQFLKYFPEYEKKLRIVHNITSVIDIRNRAHLEKVSIAKGKINICTVCRCDIKVKGLDRVLKVFCELKKQKLCDGVKWHIIGDGNDYEELKNEINKYNLNDIVVLYGSKKNPLPYLLDMDLFLLLSRYEGKPVSVTEAQILGLPCILTNYESASSQVVNNFNGKIVDNNYDSIYEEIKNILENPEIIKEWRNNVPKIEYGNEKEIEYFYKILEESNKERK